MPSRSSSTLLVFALVAGSAPLVANPGPLFVGLAASADDPTTAAANQAAMTRFDTRVLRIGVATYGSDNKWRGNFGQGGTEQTEHGGGSGYAPFFALVQPIDDRWKFGMTFVAPSSSADEYDDDWVGRYFVTEYSLASVSAVPSIAWRANDRLSLGLAAYATYTQFEFETAVFNVDPGFGDGSVRLEADGLSVGWGASLLWELDDHTRFGMRYQSEIDPELDDRPRFRGLGPLTEGILDKVGALNSTIAIRSRSPQSVLVGGYHELRSGWSLSADLVWLDFSEFVLSEFRFNGRELLSASGNYQDIWAMSAGAATPVRGRWQFGGGLLYVTSGVEDADRTMLLRLDDAWGLGTGAEWRWREDRRVGVTLNWLRMGDAPVTTNPIASLGTLSGRFEERDLWFATFTVDLGRAP